MEDDSLLALVSSLEVSILSELPLAIGGVSPNLVDLEAALDPESLVAAALVEFDIS